MQPSEKTMSFAIFHICKSYACAILCFMCVAFMPPANAQWTGGVEGGTVVRDSGSATRLRFVVRNDEKPFSQYIYAEWLRAGSDGNSYALGYRPRYWLNDTYYAFGESELRTDEPLGIDREIKLLAGLGGQFINTEEQGLFVEAGVGGRSIDYELTDEERTEALGLARVGYYRKIADAIKFDLNAATSRSDEDTEVNSEVGLSLRVPRGSVRIAYRSRYLKRGDADSLTDSDTSVSFGYSF